jgi:hypothetical protein
MSDLDTMISEVFDRGLAIKVYANNPSVFGFGIYRNLDGCGSQIGWVCFDTSAGMAKFHSGALGIIEYNSSRIHPRTAQKKFIERLASLVPAK